MKSHDFVVRGQRKAYWGRPDFFTSTERTNTTKGLAAKKIYSPENYRPVPRAGVSNPQTSDRDRVNFIAERIYKSDLQRGRNHRSSSIGNFSFEFNRPSALLQNDIQRNNLLNGQGLDYDDDGASSTDSISEAQRNLMEYDLRQLDNSIRRVLRTQEPDSDGSSTESSPAEQSFSRAKPHDVAEWYTNPVHLRSPTIESTEEFLRKSANISTRTKSSPDRESGVLGIGEGLVNENSTNQEESEIIQLIHSIAPSYSAGMEVAQRQINNRIDGAALNDADIYFPHTLGKSHNSILNKPPATQTVSKPVDIKTPKWNMMGSLRAQSTPLYGKRAVRESILENKPTNPAYLVSQNIVSHGIEKSPFADELAKLRMEGLRIEEMRLLEMKRQQELERIRGPKPKWYEARGPEFHYEARKNNIMLKSRDKWQSLVDYRSELLKSSNEFTERMKSVV